MRATTELFHSTNLSCERIFELALLSENNCCRRFPRFPSGDGLPTVTSMSIAKVKKNLIEKFSDKERTEEDVKHREPRSDENFLIDFIYIPRVYISSDFQMYL